MYSLYSTHVLNAYLTIYELFVCFSTDVREVPSYDIMAQIMEARAAFGQYRAVQHSVNTERGSEANCTVQFEPPSNERTT